MSKLFDDTIEKELGDLLGRIIIETPIPTTLDELIRFDIPYDKPYDK